jgi:hypothetical protein
MQGVPNDLTYFLNEPLQIIKHQIIPLVLYNLHKTALQEEPYAIELIKCLAQRLIKEALHHRKGFPRTKIFCFGKEFPNAIGSISPPLLSEWTTKELVFHYFH